MLQVSRSSCSQRARKNRHTHAPPPAGVARHPLTARAHQVQLRTSPSPRPCPRREVAHQGVQRSAKGAARTISLAVLTAASGPASAPRPHRLLQRRRRSPPLLLRLRPTRPSSRNLRRARPPRASCRRSACVLLAVSTTLIARSDETGQEASAGSCRWERCAHARRRAMRLSAALRAMRAVV